MGAGSRACQARVDSGRSSSGGGSSKGSNSSNQGHYHGQTVRTGRKAAVRYADARNQVDKTESGTKERGAALKELEDASKNVDAENR